MAAFTSPFANELCTNYVPSSRDRDHIRDLLIEPQKRLAQLEGNISELEQALEALKQERNTLDNEIQKHIHLLSPIRRLPDDMLREIFLACLPDTHNAIMSCTTAPLLLGLICNRWRLLAYSTPRLWATLHIPFPWYQYRPIRNPETSHFYKPYDDRIKKHCAALEDWLSRSASCPLSISFHMPADGVSRHDLSFQPYMNIILSFSHRWYNLEMTIPAGQLSDIMTSIPTTSIPILTQLCIIFSSRISISEAAEWKTSALLNAPRLRTLSINYIPFPPSHLPGSCWSHLSSLDLIHIYHHPQSRTNVATIQEAYNILSRCSRLTHCALDVFGGEISFPTDIISLPYLRSLSIIESCPSISTLFECFTNLPELRGITYQTSQLASYSRRSPLVTLLARTNQVAYLSIDFGAVTLDDLTAVFYLAPNLTHLTDETSRISNSRIRQLPRTFIVEKAVLDLLTPLDISEIHCPRLQSLHINKRNRISDISDADILSFLQSRMGTSKSPIRNIEPIREFRATFPRAMELDIRAQLLDCIEDGSLNLNLVYQPKRTPPKAQFDPRNGLVMRTVPALIQACHT